MWRKIFDDQIKWKKISSKSNEQWTFYVCSRISAILTIQYPSISFRLSGGCGCYSNKNEGYRHLSGMFDVWSETLITFYRWANFVITFDAEPGKQKMFWNSTLRSIQNIVIDEKRQHLIQKNSSFIAIGECIGSSSWFMNPLYLLKLINHSLWFYYVLWFLNFSHSFS